METRAGEHALSLPTSQHQCRAVLCLLVKSCLCHLLTLSQLCSFGIHSDGPLKAGVSLHKLVIINHGTRARAAQGPTERLQVAGSVRGLPPPRRPRALQLLCCLPKVTLFPFVGPSRPCGGEPSDLCAGLGLTWCGTVVRPGLWVDRPAGPILILPLAFRVALGKLLLAPRSVCFLVSTASEVSQEHLLTQTGAKFASTESRPWLCALKALCACYWGGGGGGGHRSPQSCTRPLLHS